MRKINKNKFDISRKTVLIEALEKFNEECYAYAQPPLNYKKRLKEIKDGKLSEEKDGPTYEYHYLSEENLKSIREKYMYAYNIHDHFHDAMDYLLEMMQNETTVYVNRSDKYDPSTRPAEKEETINAVKFWDGYVRPDSDYSSFMFSSSLGSQPSSNKEAVIRKWKDKGIDITIKDFDIEE